MKPNENQPLKQGIEGTTAVGQGLRESAMSRRKFLAFGFGAAALAALSGCGVFPGREAEQTPPSSDGKLEKVGRNTSITFIRLLELISASKTYKERLAQYQCTQAKECGTKIDVRQECIVGFFETTAVLQNSFPCDKFEMTVNWAETLKVLIQAFGLERKKVRSAEGVNLRMQNGLPLDQNSWFYGYYVIFYEAGIFNEVSPLDPATTVDESFVAALIATIERKLG